jgi:hypothetical protein
MSAINRQNRLLVAEDWKKIYQSFRNADFQSYDFENLRRTMIDYIRQNYPEDFNDYIESSEYLALVDVIAFLGQSIAFRVDLNARENFLELAERRDSVLRLARMVSYNAKRNIAAKGLLKFSTIQTTQSVIDSTGRNLSGQVITWNDPSNTNWYDQFISILNAAFPTTQQFGSPSDKATIYNIPTEQYRFNSVNTDVPVYSFSKNVSGRSMTFEITSTTFSGKEFIYEEAPKLNNRIACVYRDDGRGYGSAGSGFFFNFTQGILNTGTFSIEQPSNNESVDIDSQSINNTDVWLYKLDQNGLESTLWTPVPSLEGNNIIYNSLNKNIRSIYTITTRAGDAVSLGFSDGTFGNKPSGKFRTYYRVSNGLSYSINTKDIRNIAISIPYLSATNQQEVLSLTLSLASSVANSEMTETNASIKANAPANYYTQNRMVTGEDYNISPLSVNQQVLKVKSINRAASGISRYFDLVDPTGKYSSTNLFADDGVLYKEEFVNTTKFSYQNKTDIEGIITNVIYELIKKQSIRDYYYSRFVKFISQSLNISWNTVTLDVTSSTGYIGSDANDGQIYAVGSYASTDLKYFKQGALVRFAAPEGYYFDTNNSNALVLGTGDAAGASSYIWAEIVKVTDDGRALGKGVLSTGDGPILMNVPVPSKSIITQIIPSWRTIIPSSVITTMVDLIFSNKPFGLRYDSDNQAWSLIFEQNLNISAEFSLGNQGDLTNKQKDASWLLLFTTDNEFYTVTSRELRYVFESDKQIRFYFDSNSRVYDSRTNTLVKDSIRVLGINTLPDSTTPMNHDLVWEIAEPYIGLDGYVDTKKVIVTFSDFDNNGVVDNPELFISLVAPSDNPLSKYIVEEKYAITYGQDDYRYISNSSSTIIVLDSVPDDMSSFTDGQYFYFTNLDTVKRLDKSTADLVPTLDYLVYSGRDLLKFQYIHNADHESRIDPGVSNIIDVYILTKQYDISMRQWVNGSLTSKPLPPSTDELYNTMSPSLSLIKTMSDEIVYHPVKYKILFGTNATPELQATFKITKTPGVVLSDNDIKSQVITAVNQFFVLDNWDFGDTFYFSELSAYIMNKLAPNIANFVIVPVKSGLSFGSLFEIKSANNEIFISGATVDDIQIISGITASNIKSGVSTNATTVSSQQAITSSSYGSI